MNQPPGVPDPERIEKACRAYELRLHGHSLRRIADIMTAEGTRISHTSVATLIDEECDRRPTPLVERYRKQQLDQLNIAITELMAELAQGKSVARNAEVLVKVSERQAKLLGVDAPTKVESTVTVTEASEVDDEIRRLSIELGMVPENGRSA